MLCTICKQEKPIERFWLRYGKPRRECRDCGAAANKAWHKSNPVKTSDRMRKKFWKQAGINISVQDYRARKTAQDFKCAVCGVDESALKRKLAVDHDHKTGKIRGLLCLICNSRIVEVVEHYSHLIPKVREYLDGQNAAAI